MILKQNDHLKLFILMMKKILVLEAWIKRYKITSKLYMK